LKGAIEVPVGYTPLVHVPLIGCFWQSGVRAVDIGGGIESVKELKILEVMKGVVMYEGLDRSLGGEIVRYLLNNTVKNGSFVGYGVR
jgi:hypothetical protein